MGAMAELRPIIVIGSFMGIIVVLISIMPSGFFSSNANTVTPISTTYYDLLAGTNQTLIYNLTGSTHDFGNNDFGGWHINAQEKQIVGDEMSIWMQIADAWYGFFYNREDFIWYTSNNTKANTRETIENWQGQHEVMRISTLNNTYAQYGIENLFYYLRSSRTTIKAIFSFDTTYYNTSTLYQAYLDGNLTMIMGIDFNERNTQINAWSVISAFLTFQLIPNCEPTIALIIEIPFWFAELYVVFILVLRIIGAVFGGGGA